MASTEQKIENLQRQLSALRSSSSYPTNCEDIAKIDIQLARIYASQGNTMQYQDSLEDAIKALQDPMCQKNRRTESMIKSLEYYKDKPQVVAAANIPAIYRYLSIIVLIIGYVAIYALYYEFRNTFTSSYFLGGIIAVFFVSIFINLAVRSKVNRRARQLYN
ncbi:MAG: hypothetical protein QW364_05290 [Thermoplasmatales archaeon]